MKQFARLGLLLVVLAVIASSIGWAQGLERQLTITMGEFYFQVQGQGRNEAISLEVAVPYRVTFKNEGNVVHRVKFGRGLIVEEGVPYAYAENLFNDVPLRVEGITESGADFRVTTNQMIELDLEPGGEIAVVFTLPQSAQGTWELGCFVIGHYEAGMRANLIVQ